MYGFADLTGTGYGTLNIANDGLSGNSYGTQVSIDGTNAIVGAPFHEDSGVGYVYDVTKKMTNRFHWVFTPWPYKYIYMGCPLWILQDTPATITMDRGRLPLSFSIGQAPRNGRLRFADETTLEYVPNCGFTGADVFTVRVTDPAGVVLEKTANVTVVAR